MIEGYQGIMPLDTRNMKPEYRKQAIERHYKDIQEYQLEQSQLKPELRYENTILRIKKQHELENMHCNIRAENERLQREQQDKIRTTR
jgi:DNA-binding SARP family transcriptional activator